MFIIDKNFDVNKALQEENSLKDISLKNCKMQFIPIDIKDIDIIKVSRSILNNSVKPLVDKPIIFNKLNRYLSIMPWFSINGKKFIMKYATYSDVVIDLIDYIDNQSTDCSITVKPNELSELIINDHHGLVIYLTFKNTSNVSAMRETSKLIQFVINYTPDNSLERARFNNYIPFDITEDKWRFYTNIKPQNTFKRQNASCYKYFYNKFFTEVWFSEETGQLVAIKVNS